jgi:ribosomal protein S18 acetylase RimI-like enzyme
MAGLHIRDARPTDHDAISALTLAAYQEYAPLMSAHWEGYRQNIVDTLADVKPAEQIVAEHGGHMVGTVLLYPAGTVFSSADGLQVTLRWPEVRLLAVLPGARGQGVGTALMRECVRRAGQAGAAALTLHTTDIMEAAIRLYERLGFMRASELDFHPAPDVTAKGYRFDLAATVRQNAGTAARCSA